LKQGSAVKKVGALFTDYDGTISPINVSRSESRVPPEIMFMLNRIRERIPVAVITTKSLEFVVAKKPQDFLSFRISLFWRGLRTDIH